MLIMLTDIHNIQKDDNFFYFSKWKMNIQKWDVINIYICPKIISPSSLFVSHSTYWLDERCHLKIFKPSCQNQKRVGPNLIPF